MIKAQVPVKQSWFGIVWSCMVVWCCMIFIGSTASGGEIYPLDRMVKLNIWGQNIEDVIQEIRTQTGIDLVYFKPDFPPEKEKKQIYLVTGRVSLRLVMECLSRRLGCRYRLSESGRLEMSVGYGWAGSDFVVRFNELDSLMRPGMDTQALSQTLWEFLRVLHLLPGNFSFTIEESPAPGGGRSAKAVTILPLALADYFDKAIRCLKGESGDSKQTTAANQSIPRAVAIERTPWSQLLASSFDLPTGDADPKSVMRDICNKLNIAIMLNGNPGEGEVRSGILAGVTGFGRATEELGGAFGLNRRLFLNPGAVIFEAGKTSGWEEENKSREFFWSGLTVAGFEVTHLAARLRPNELTNKIRQNVFPEVWYDPMCGLVLNPTSERLVVIAPGNVVEAVANEIKRLENEIR